MYLASLTISNFRRIKSATIEFEPGLNIIVGPNNIGKTAVVDALRSLLAGTDDPQGRNQPFDARKYDLKPKLHLHRQTCVHDVLCRPAEVDVRCQFGADVDAHLFDQPDNWAAHHHHVSLHLIPIEIDMRKRTYCVCRLLRNEPEIALRPCKRLLGLYPDRKRGSFGPDAAHLFA
ncbi:AAA family ATPase [Rhodobacteraceae bacterium F11138]|nr:AAA family ATPase [Rhodobacteraceae bacterium F11138]